MVDYALETAARILNMVPTKKVEKTPYRVWHGQAPKLSYLKVWGCEALVKRDTLTKPDKLEHRVVGSTSECNMDDDLPINKDDDLPINNDRQDLNNMLDDLDDDVAQKEHAKCYLFSPYTKDKTPIAWGGCTSNQRRYYPWSSHNSYIHKGDSRQGQAIGSFFQWPQCRISRMKEITPTSKNKDQQMKTTMLTSVLTLEIDLVAENTTSVLILQQKDALKNAQKLFKKPITAAQKAAAQEAKEVLENRLIDVGDTIGVRGPLSNVAYLRYMSRDDSTLGYVVDVPVGAIQVDAVKFQPLWSVKPIFDSRKSMPSQYFSC
ncbi:hypothetical protein Tco_1319424 [Tanacetum coccineum]